VPRRVKSPIQVEKEIPEYMANKPDPQRLIAANYPNILRFDTQFSDMDVYGHLNNLAIARFYESARARLILQITGRDDFYRPETPEKIVLIETRLRYLAEGQYPAPVDIASGIGHMGNSSLHMHQALFQGGICIGLCDVVMVYAVDGKPCRPPTALREQFEQRRLVHVGKHEPS
jgi:acyl-CoA thioester hydrolase